MYLLYFLIQFERQPFVGASTSEPEGADSIRLVGRVKWEGLGGGGGWLGGWIKEKLISTSNGLFTSFIWGVHRTVSSSGDGFFLAFFIYLISVARLGLI